MGYATEAARRLVQFAFEELGRTHVRPAGFTTIRPRAMFWPSWGRAITAVEMRDCRARGRAVLCHDMLLTRADFLRKQAA